MKVPRLHLAMFLRRRLPGQVEALAVLVDMVVLLDMAARLALARG